MENLRKRLRVWLLSEHNKSDCKITVIDPLPVDSNLFYSINYMVIT